jgi:hypothetical protein
MVPPPARFMMSGGANFQCPPIAEGIETLQTSFIAREGTCQGEICPILKWKEQGNSTEPGKKTS